MTQIIHNGGAMPTAFCTLGYEEQCNCRFSRMQKGQCVFLFDYHCTHEEAVELAWEELIGKIAMRVTGGKK